MNRPPTRQGLPGRPPVPGREPVETPTSTPPVVTARKPALSPVARQARAAQIRGVIAATMTALTLVGVVLSFFWLPWWAPLLTALALVGVMISGRRAAVAGIRSPATAMAGQAAIAGPGSSPVAARGAKAEAAAPTELATEVEPKAAEAATAAAWQASERMVEARPGRLGKRRPGVSGRITPGQHDFAMPAPLVITEVDLGIVTTKGNDTDTEVLPAAAEVAPSVAAPKATKDRAKTKAKADLPASGKKAKTAGSKSWTPTAVPPPSYTLSAPAAGWEPRALTEDDFAKASQAAMRATEQATAEALAVGVEGPVTATRGLPARQIFADKGIDLDRALEKRRTANE
ncbi:MAG: hypothetical protein FWD29_01150 [Micrococcales bacterium]|nr:hypothetical protein [Micrococcales bacterium]